MTNRERLALCFLAVGVLYLTYKIHEVVLGLDDINQVIAARIKEELQEEYDEEFGEIVDEQLWDIDS